MKLRPRARSRTVLLIVALTASVVPVAPSAAQADLVAAYSFDAGSGSTISDTTGNGNTLTVSGALWSGGRYGSSLSFDGVDDVAVASGSNPALNLSGRSFTLSAWINPRSNNGPQLIVDKPATTGHSPPFFDWSMIRESGTGRLTVYLGCEGVHRPSNSSIPLNVWTHVAVTYDGTALRHYINGTLDRTSAVTCAIANTSSRPIRIGANGGGAEVMNGLIDDVRIYNRTQSPAEIQADLAQSLGDSTAPDTNAPAVSLTAPLNGATVNGTVTLSANASDDVGVSGVQFKVDGVNVGSEDQSAPYSVAWNTTQVGNGNHSITATARDAAGNVTTSSLIVVNVNNSTATPAPTVTLSANPTSINSGGSSTLSWSSTDATSCTASGAWSGSRATSGSQSTGPLNATSTYTLTCSGSGGTTARSVTISVNTSAPAPSVTLSASPTTVAQGTSTTLTWTSSDATACNASGAWSGTRPTSGSASSGPLSAASNSFTLTCSGPGGSSSRTVTVLVQGGVALSGLDFQGNASTTGTVRFRFTNPLAIYPATYIWRVKPRHQIGYYTTFFWGNDGEFTWGGVYGADTYYGAHPYPPGGSTGSTHKWEIASRAGDDLSAEDVVYDVWYTQALRVWSDASGKHHEFYWDLPNMNRVIRVDRPNDYGNIYPPRPALTWGDAPWAQSEEIMNGVLRGIQVYSNVLTVAEIQNEIAEPLSTSTGASGIWYINLNPTPSDISDKSGRGNHPEWVGPERPLLWTGP